MIKQPGKYPFGQILHYNPPISEVSQVGYPKISSDSVIGPNSIIIGEVTVESDVFIGYHNLIRSDSSYPIYIGKCTNIQDYILIHVHPAQYVEVNGQKMGVYIEDQVSILHHAAPHGPLFIGRNTFIGQHVSIYGAKIGRNCVIMHGATIANYVNIPDNRFVEPGQTVWKQEQADALPEVPPEFKGLNTEIVNHYYRLGKTYKANTNLFV